MKHLCTCITICILLIALVSCNRDVSQCPPDEIEGSNTPTEWKVYVLKEVPAVNIIIENDIPYISVVPLLVEYGYRADWKNETYAILIKNGEEYYLNLDDKTLKDQNDMDYIECGEGSTEWHAYVVGQELYIDVGTAGRMLRFLGEHISGGRLDSENGIIYVGNHAN